MTCIENGKVLGNGNGATRRVAPTNRDALSRKRLGHGLVGKVARARIAEGLLGL